MRFFIEKEAPQAVSLGLIYSYEGGYKKLVAVSLFRWILVWEFGKGSGYDWESELDKLG